MYLGELTSYKLTLLHKFCHSPAIVDLVTCGNRVEETDDLVYTKLFPYTYMPNIKTEQGVFICCDVEIPNLDARNNLFKDTALIIDLLVHRNLMKADGGTRLDLLADQVDRLLNNSRDFGMGCELKLTSVKKFIPNDEYYGAELYYAGSELYSPGRSAHV